MANTTKFGEIETMVRRDIINDNDSTQYRWSSFQLMSCANRAVIDIANRYNVWCGYDMVTGARKTNLNTELISKYCDADPQTISGYDETTTFTDGPVTYTGITQFLNGTPQEGSTPAKPGLRGKVIPIDDRYRNSIAYLTAAKMLETDNSDTANAQKAIYFIGVAQDYAQMSNLKAVASGAIFGRQPAAQ